MHTAQVAGVDTLLALAADMERRDSEAAAAIELVTSLDRRAGEIRVRSGELRRFLDVAPGELAALDRREAEAGDASRDAAAVLVEAEQRQSELGARAGAGHEVELARELVAEAAARVGRLALERVAHVEATAARRAELAELVREAGRVAAEVREVPRVSQSGREVPASDPARLAEWCSRVHAALFVVRGQLEGERERLVREANELGTAALGEYLAGSSVMLVRRRLEEALQT